MKPFWDINEPLLCDGSLGVLLQQRGLPPGERPETWNLTRPETMMGIHREYAEAGAQVMSANTFGANRLHYAAGGAFSLEDIIRAGIANAKQLDRYVAMDIGSTGKLLKPLGDLCFEEAVDIFREAGALGAEAGADFFFIETMTDLLEIKAAVLGLKEAAPELPIFVSFTLEENGRLLTGATPAAAAVMLEGLGVAALGLNCCAGPGRIKQALPGILAVTHLPVIAQPNAGLPVIRDGVTQFDLSPDDFAEQMMELLAMGAGILGGCCGTTPAHIRALTQRCKSIKIAPRAPLPHPVISSAARVVAFHRPVIIGERINPTGKPTFQKHLREGNWDYILDEAVSQAQAGAQVLDVNVGLPGIDEGAAMLQAVTRIQQATALPLQIDSSDPAVLEAALGCYQGKALVNSVNGKEESMRAVFPLVKKYGGAVVALLLDEDGIPETVEGRLAIAERIAARAAQYGLGKRDLLFDALALTVSAAPASAAVTLETMARLRAQGWCTALGVSNISFGLPRREVINAAFFAMALQNGLRGAIINPKSATMMGAYRSFCLFSQMDPNCEAYLQFCAAAQAEAAVPMQPVAAAPQASTSADPLFDAILQGREEAAQRLAAQALQSDEALGIVRQSVLPALDEAGRGFAKGTLFLPQLLRCAGAAKAELAPLQEEIARTGGSAPAKGTIVLATVQGDIHDIGKNIAKTLLETYHYEVIDLGKDVPPQAVADAVTGHRAALCGLSALMTTTVPAMEQTIRLLREQAAWCRVLVGGAVLTQAEAARIGADAYCADAMEGVRAAERLLAQ